MIAEDTACAPAKGIAAAKKLLHQDEVFYLHGNSCSAVAMAVKPTVEPSGIPWIIAHAVNPNISMPVTEHRNIFHGVPAGPAYGSTMGEFVMSKPDTKRIAMVTHTNDWAKSYCDPAIEVIKASGGEIVEELALERGQTDATAQVLKLKQANPDFVLGCLYEAETVIFLRDAKKYGVRIPVMGTAGTDLENTLERLGDPDAVKDYYVLHAFVDKVDGPKMTQWNDIILKYKPRRDHHRVQRGLDGERRRCGEGAPSRGPRPHALEVHRRAGEDSAAWRRASWHATSPGRRPTATAARSPPWLASSTASRRCCRPGASLGDLTGT